MSQVVTKPIALDETLQATNTALGLLGKDTTLQSIVTALASIGINTVGNLASLVTTDKSSLVGAVNEVAGDKISKSQTAGLVKNDGSIDTESYTDEIDAIVNVYGSKNLFDIEGWLNKIGEQYTKSGSVYNVSFTGVSYSNLYQFSDTDIQITLSVSGLSITGTGTLAQIWIYNSLDEPVEKISSDNFNSSITCIGCKVRLAANNPGTISISSPMLRDARISDPTYVPYAMTNRELTENIGKIGTYRYLGSITQVNTAFDLSSLNEYKNIAFALRVNNYQTIDIKEFNYNLFVELDYSIYFCLYYTSSYNIFVKISKVSGQDAIMAMDLTANGWNFTDIAVFGIK